MTTKRPILVVEDDNDLRPILVEQLLSGDCFSVTEAPTQRDAQTHLSAEDARYDAVILDIGLPDGDGRTFCSWMRREGYRMPVIMLTGAAGENDVVTGLESGANDYISKPFRGEELLARIRAQLRLHEDSEDAVVTIGPYTFRPAAKQLLDPSRNARIRLTDKEKNILKTLYRANEKPVSRHTLLAEVWGYNARVTTHTLETHIYRLRQKMERNVNDWQLLLTTEGGYRLNLHAA